MPSTIDARHGVGLGRSPRRWRDAARQRPGRIGGVGRVGEITGAYPDDLTRDECRPGGQEERERRRQAPGGVRRDVDQLDGSAAADLLGE